MRFLSKIKDFVNNIKKNYFNLNFINIALMILNPYLLAKRKIKK